MAQQMGMASFQSSQRQHLVYRWARLTAPIQQAAEDMAKKRDDPSDILKVCSVHTDTLSDPKVQCCQAKPVFRLGPALRGHSQTLTFWRHSPTCAHTKQKQLHRSRADSPCCAELCKARCMQVHTNLFAVIRTWPFSGLPECLHLLLTGQPK